MEILLIIEPYLIYITLTALTFCVLLLVWNIVLEMRLRRLTRGHDGESLEAHLANIARDYQDLEAFKKEIQENISGLDTRIKGSVRGIGMVRFNPFSGSGDSKPSFAAAFLSEAGSGLLISTLSTRGSLSIFSKNVVDFKSKQELTQEEAEALEKARNSLHT